MAIRNARRALILLGILCSQTMASGLDDAGVIPAFIERAAVHYRNTVTIPVTVERWNRLVDHPCLLTGLWRCYGFEPAYQAVAADGVVTVIDPTGIKARLTELPPEGRTRWFIGNGTLNHRLIPVGLKGSALFSFTPIPAPDGCRVTINIYGEGGDNVVMDMAIRAVAPLLRHLIDKRVTEHVRDLAILARDLDGPREHLRETISPELFDELSAMLDTSPRPRGDWNDRTMAEATGTADESIRPLIP